MKVRNDLSWVLFTFIKTLYLSIYTFHHPAHFIKLITLGGELLKVSVFLAPKLFVAFFKTVDYADCSWVRETNCNCPVKILYFYRRRKFLTLPLGPRQAPLRVEPSKVKVKIQKTLAIWEISIGIEKNNKKKKLANVSVMKSNTVCPLLCQTTIKHNYKLFGHITLVLACKQRSSFNFNSSFKSDFQGVLWTLGGLHEMETNLHDSSCWRCSDNHPKRGGILGEWGIRGIC